MCTGTHTWGLTFFSSSAPEDEDTPPVSSAPGTFLRRRLAECSAPVVDAMPGSAMVSFPAGEEGQVSADGSQWQD